MSGTRLKLDGLSLRYGDVDVLRDITLDVKTGEFVSIVGPSGSGKSTILKILNHAATADSGEILFDGNSLGPDARPFAFMPQRDALMPWRRVIDNVIIGLEIQGVKRRDARRLVEPLIGEFGLSGFEHQYPDALSGGMRQRAALLRTVIQERPMLLLDEPFGALDALTRNRMQLWLEEMWLKHRWTVMLVTHDIREAVMLSDRIYVLSPRPAHVVQTVEVPLPRPRMRDGSLRTEAAAIEGTILDTLFSPQSISRQEGHTP
jgi:ABC-type nitrate/sulfonate/bicarbonate transport system ATPase subunit